ncbi:MAG TPA: 1-deoxy-D-xylulose-5-phosphate synthase N-terminal domain-containing protein [Gaiella sp.]|jgi:transketolase
MAVDGTATLEHRELERLAARIRLAAVRMVSPHGFGYLGQALSSAEIFAVLFGRGHVRPGHDRFVLSPGHYAIALYAVAAELGLVPEDELGSYGADGALLEAIATERTPLVDLTCGSLGQGLSGAAGLALADRLAGRERRTVAFLSDGELQEGQVWEAAMFAAHHHLDALTVVVDANGSQCDGPVRSVTTIEPVAARWSAFNWTCFEVDGHDVGALAGALDDGARAPGPAVVVARTEIFGRLTSLPDAADGHFVKLSDTLEDSVTAELEEAVARA